MRSNVSSLATVPLRGSLEQHILDACCPSAQAKMDRKADSAGVMIGIIASYTDGVGGSSSKVFPRISDCLKWLCQMQAQDTHVANPAPGLRILSCKIFQAN